MYEATLADKNIFPLTRSMLHWFSDVAAGSGSRLRQSYDRTETKAGKTES